MIYDYSNKNPEWKKIFRIAKELAIEKLKDMRKVILNSIKKKI